MRRVWVVKRHPCAVCGRISAYPVVCSNTCRVRGIAMGKFKVRLGEFRLEGKP